MSSICEQEHAWVGCRRTTACLPTSLLSTLMVTGTSTVLMSSMCELSSIESTSKMLLGAARPISEWQITKIAALNDGIGGTIGTRKVFFAADVVLTRNYSAILFGTGDREKPLLAPPMIVSSWSRTAESQRRTYHSGDPAYRSESGDDRRRGRGD